MNDLVPVTHLPILLRPDPSRTVMRPFLPNDPELYAVSGDSRAQRIAERILSLDDTQVHEDLDRVRATFGSRGRDIDQQLLHRFEEVAAFVPGSAELRQELRILIGGYFSTEYAHEAAALFNPTVVPLPEQNAASSGAVRLLIALRGIGEGHLSSITFRTGVWEVDGTVSIDWPSPVSMPPVLMQKDESKDGTTVTLDCSRSHDLSETVLFPVTESQSRGIEDLRLTPFTHADGSRTYLGTFTALSERGVRQEMVETADFHRIAMWPVAGSLAFGKGMAVFPRQLDGRYAAIGRQDGENLWLYTYSDLLTWHGGIRILRPAQPWEFVQIGNCGSPIEIKEGWQLLTHGVGVARNYCIGAVLLDRKDPTKVLGRLASPLIEPSAGDRDGYVPNVVYSCGGMVRDRALLLPYGVADNYTRLATIQIDDLIAAMR